MKRIVLIAALACALQACEEREIYVPKENKNRSPADETWRVITCAAAGFL